MPVSLRVSSFVAACAALFVTWPAFAQAPPSVDNGGPPAMTSDPSCAVERHEGVSDADAAGVEEVVCGLVRADRHPGRYRIRITKLGAKVVLTLARSAGGSAGEKQIVLSGLDEVSVAAPRLLAASAEQKPVAETMDVTNVVGDEARRPKKRHPSVHGWLGLLGAAAAGHTGGGVNLGLSAGSERWSFVGDLRLAGEAFNKPAALMGAIFTLGSVDIDSDAELSFVSLGAGARHHLLLTDVSPFVGMGLGLDYLSFGARAPSTTPYYSSSERSGKTGIAGYAEVGLDVLRTHAVGGAIVFRADMPAFAVDETKPDPADPSRQFRRSTIAPVLGAGIALRF